MMRETITSEIFYEHDYIGTGTLGIIRDGIIKRIFGNTSFEAATLDSIILPRHRPRVWDAKKLTNFGGKIHSIPSEFRSYYPHTPEMSRDGNASEMIPNKKRGRPVGTITTNNEEKKSLKKQVKTTNSTLASNSILKYFGSKVATAIAQPSRSAKPPSDTSLDLNVLQLSISKEDSISTKEIEIVPCSLEHILGHCLPPIPYILPSQTPSVPMEASPTIFIMPPTIVEEEENAEEVLYGLVWANCSCSFDTVLTILLFLFLSLSNERREEFLRALPFFGAIIANIIPTSMTSISKAKLECMVYFVGGAMPKYEVGKYYAVEEVYLSMMESLQGNNEFFRVKYSVSSSCFGTVIVWVSDKR